MFQVFFSFTFNDYGLQLVKIKVEPDMTPVKKVSDS